MAKQPEIKTVKLPDGIEYYETKLYIPLEPPKNVDQSKAFKFQQIVDPNNKKEVAFLNYYIQECNEQAKIDTGLFPLINRYIVSANIKNELLGWLIPFSVLGIHVFYSKLRLKGYSRKNVIMKTGLFSLLPLVVISTISSFRILESNNYMKFDLMKTKDDELIQEFLNFKAKNKLI